MTVASKSAGAALPDGRAAVLKIDGLARRFGNRQVVRHLGLDLGRGDRVALRGPNGSGKTTVLRCVVGTLAPTAGTVHVAGHEAGTLAARAQLGASFAQERSFYLRLRGRDNLLFYARLRARSERQARAVVDAVVEELELGAFVQERVSTYSTGMVQQLGVARALLGEPALLVLDEPTRSLDVDAVTRLWAAVDRRAGLAVLIATHRPEDVERCGDEVWLPT